MSERQSASFAHSSIVLCFTPWQFPLDHFLTDLPVTFNLLFLGLVASFFCFGAWSFVTEKVGAVTIANYN